MSVKNKILFIHNQNDFSGSTQVARMTISSLKLSSEVDIYLAEGEEDGLLNDYYSSFKTYANIFKKRSKISKLVSFIIGQIHLFIKICFTVGTKGKHKVVYVNTMLPVGAMLACLLMRQKYIVHVHELSIGYIFIERHVVQRLISNASGVIYVSKYQKKRLANIRNKKKLVVYNGTDISTLERSNVKATNFRVLMLCSARKYKGIDAFLKVSKNYLSRDTVTFRLVINGSRLDFNRTWPELPSNVEIFFNQSNVEAHYNASNIVLNLSDPQYWIETFGMTIIEAMQFGIPSIVPNLGGPKEIVESSKSGSIVDPLNIEEITYRLDRYIDDTIYYQEKSMNCSISSIKFKSTIYTKNVLDAVDDILS